MPQQKGLQHELLEGIVTGGALEPIKEALEHPGESQFMDWRRSADIAIRRIEDHSYEGDAPGFFDQYLRFFGDVFG